jgi:hypothetical protein
MKQNLSAIKEYLTNIFKRTDDLEKLEAKINDIILDDLIKDFTLHRTYKEKFRNYYIYEVKEDDFSHILEYLKPIQDIIFPDLVVMAQKQNDEHRIIFRQANDSEKSIKFNYYEDNK